MGIEGKHAYRFVYLKSPKWENVRLDALVREQGKCQICGEEDINNDGHHLWYPPSFWDTTSDHLIVLCRPCHEFIHAFLPKYSDKEAAESDWYKLIKGLREWRVARLTFVANPTDLMAPKPLRDALERAQAESKGLKSKILQLEAAIQLTKGEIPKPVLTERQVSDFINALRAMVETCNSVVLTHSQPPNT